MAKGTFEIMPDSKQYFYYINSEDIESEIRHIKRENIKNIGLNRFKGYKLDNIRALSELNFIEKLSIEITNIDIAGLVNFSNLDFLYFQDDNNQQIDFKYFNNIRYLNIRLHTNILNLANCKSMRGLYVSDFDASKMNKIFFSVFKKIRSLTLNNVKNLVDLDYFDLPSSLEELNLFYCKKLENIDAIQKLNGSLKKVEISVCKKIFSLEILGKVQSLEKLIIFDSAPIQNASSFASLDKLKHLTVMGSSYFINGDLNALVNIVKEGVYVGIDNKRHYSHTFEQLNPYFKSGL